MLLRGVLGAAVAEHLGLVELVDADDAARVLARGAGLAAVAGGPAHVALRAGAQVEDLVGVVAGEGDLGRARQVQVVGGQVVDFVGVLVEKAGAAHDLRGDQGGGHHRHEAVGERLIHGHRHDGQLEAGADALEVVEARAGDLRAALGVDRIQALAEREVVLGLEALSREVAGGGALVAQNHEVVLAADGHAVEDQVGQEAGQAVGLGVGGVRGGLGGLDLLGELLGLGQDRGPLLLGGASHGLGDLLLGGAQRLEGLQGLAAGGVGLDDLIDEAGVGSAGTLGGAGGFGVVTQGTHINHASHPMPGGRAVSPTAPTVNSTQQVRVMHKLHPREFSKA